MTHSELKKLREFFRARQQDMADMLNVALRTYQNWEQPETSKAHRKIPAEVADKIQCLADLKKDQGGEGLPTRKLVWLQVPLLKGQLRGLKHAAILEDKSVALFIQEAIFEKLNGPED